MADSGGDAVDALGAITEKPKRGPGRPKGLGKVPGSGRQKGTCNKDRAATVEKIMREADPILFLCKVCRGDRMAAALEPGAKKSKHWYPTGDQRIQAGMALARKVMPDMKATELSSKDGTVVVTRIERVIVDPVRVEGGAVVEHEDAEDRPPPPASHARPALVPYESPGKS